jgi:hypothetical protein
MKQAHPLFYLYNHQLFSWKDQHTSEVAENFFPAGSQKTSFFRLEQCFAATGAATYKGVQSKF